MTLTAPAPSPTPSQLPLPQIELEGVRLHALREEQCVARVIDAIAQGRGGWIVTPNLDHLRRLTRDALLLAQRVQAHAFQLDLRQRQLRRRG
jgi:UDP-N-acetyl-D-mannosaminuronic acid transferase (WecB/TagA/CpsF family)